MLGSIPPAIHGLLRALSTDPLFGVSLTYRRYTGQEAFDSDLGYPVQQYASTTVQALSLQHTERTVASLGLQSSVQKGDRLYLIDGNQLLVGGLTVNDFSEKDMLTVDGTQMKISSIKWIATLALSVTVGS